MYHVTGIGITAVLLYLVSFLFCRLNLFTDAFQKKLWNTILAAAFILTAAGGIFTALQTTFKWDLPLVKTILKWHVEAGIVLAFSGSFHFLRHLSYFSGLIKKRKLPDELPLQSGWPASVIRTNLLVTGLVSTTVQLLILREMLNIAGGYELITGIFLGSWLTASAAGAIMAGRSGTYDLRKLNLIFSASPAISVALMFILSGLFLTRGQTPSFLESLVFTLLVVLPFSFVSGFTFISLTALARTNGVYSAGKSYSIETIGGVSAGVIVSLTGGLLSGTYKLLLLTVILSFAFSILTFTPLKKRMNLLLKCVFLALCSVAILSDPDLIFRQFMLKELRVISTHDTPYGNITYGDYKGEISTYYNQRLLLWNYDVIEREEDIHYAMLQGSKPEKVILISGSPASQFPELLKYNIKEITFIERDPELLKHFKGRIDTTGVSIKLLPADAFRYITNNHDNADVIISSVPPPSTFQLNRYFTTEFFRSVKNNLTPGGYFICSPGPGNDYLNKESVDLYSSVYKSLGAVFGKVRPVLGGKLYMIASDSAVSVDFCRLADEKKVRNLYVSSDYLSDDLTGRKTAELTELMDSNARENRSAYPVASYHYQSYGLSRYRGEKTPAIIILSFIFAAPLLLTRRRNILMYLSASALAGFEIIILIILQTAIGNMYQLTGLIIAVLMAGLAAGSASGRLFKRQLSVKLKAFILFAAYIFTGMLFGFISSRGTWIPAVVIIAMVAFIPALLTGTIYHDLTSGAGDVLPVSGTYSADLTGSALGFLVVSGIAIPLLGIQAALFLLGLLILAGLLFGTVSNKL